MVPLTARGSNTPLAPHGPSLPLGEPLPHPPDGPTPAKLAAELERPTAGRSVVVYATMVEFFSHNGTVAAP